MDAPNLYHSEQLRNVVARMAAERRALALKLRADGLTYREIGARFGVSRQRAEAMCKRASKDAKRRR